MWAIRPEGKENLAWGSWMLVEGWSVGEEEDQEAAQEEIQRAGARGGGG